VDIESTCKFLGEAQARSQRIVLVTVCAVEGSSMRNPGTVMGVADDGSYAGSLSGGCIENAVVAEALDALRQGGPRMVRFGAGSPYLDIRLPCGGGLDVSFHPVADAGFIPACLASIAARTPFSIAADEDGPRHLPEWRQAAFDPASGASCFGYFPAPRLQIVGHGASVEALAVMARALGCSNRILTPDARLIEGLRDRGIDATLIERTDQTDLLESDPWTACVFLFHDHDWEIELIGRALELPHFYIGAMGGRRAHAFRSEALAARGVSAAAIGTIRAPIGLFHSSRDPATLALSTLGEVIRAYETSDFEARLG
jgi:xanthine dehydrogenase accessory factor